MLVQITGTKMVRDTESMALINRDINGLQEYQLKRKQAEGQRTEINTIKSEIKDIRGELGEIKTLMAQLLDKING
jgi:hypothetical protein